MVLEALNVKLAVRNAVFKFTLISENNVAAILPVVFPEAIYHLTQPYIVVLTS
jgi:hypothetical protein